MSSPPINPLSFPIPQRVVTISIITVVKPKTLNVNGDVSYTALYSYTSPVTGLQYIRAPTCDLAVDQPTYCLFVLDFEATLAGWRIQKISPNCNSQSIENDLGPLNLSVMTYDPFNPPPPPAPSASPCPCPCPCPSPPPLPTYSFFIFYCNTMLTNADFNEDPQEGNGPRTPGPTES